MIAATRVLLAEPDEPTRVGIRLALEDQAFSVCAEPLDAAAAVRAAVRETPAVCLIDETLPGGAMVAVDGIFTRLPAVKIVMLTSSDEPATLLSSVRAGASGFLRKDLDPTRLPNTVRGVLAGEAAMSRRLTYRLMEALRKREHGRSAPTKPGGPSITDRELDVLEQLALGLRTSAIAALLSISEVTVRRHISSAVTKLGVKDRAAALRVLSGQATR